MNKIAHIIGNGKSREGFDLNLLKGHGIIFGCNALYRDFDPDWIVAIDPEIQTEIKASEWPENQTIFPPIDEQHEPTEFNPVRPRSNAGMNAMIEAIKRDHCILYCYGFDFLIKDICFADNIYEGTNAYGPETATNVESSLRRVQYFDWFCQKHPHIKFYMVFNPGPRFHTLQATNVNGMTYKTIENKIYSLNTK